MTHTGWLCSLVLVLSGCALDVGAATSASTARVTHRCEVAGLGALSAMESGGGTVRGGDTGTVGMWMHESSIGSLSATNPDWILCRINGSRLADFEGDATVDGAAGYTYRVSIQDRGTPPAPTIETLAASVEYRPTRWTDGSLPIRADSARVVLPAEIPVTRGQPGNGEAVLSFDLADGSDSINCRYYGNGRRGRGGDRYVLRHCVGRPGGVEYGAGDVVEVSAMTLHVQSGSRSCGVWRTNVEVDLEVTHVSTTDPGRDFYRMAVWDPAGVQVLLSEGVIERGDFVLTELTPPPAP